MNFEKIRDKAIQWKNALLDELTPKERKAIIIIVLLLLIGFVVKTLRES